MEFGKNHSLDPQANALADPLEERRKNMKPSEYLDWRMDNARFTDKERAEIIKEKNRVTHLIVSRIKGPMTFTNEMIDTLIDGRGETTEATIVSWTNQAMANKSKDVEGSTKDDNEVGAFNGLPKPKDVGIPEWLEPDLK